MDISTPLVVATVTLCFIAAVVGYFAARSDPKPKRKPPIVDSDGRQMPALEFDKDRKALCPNCGEPTLLGGPEGGLSQNAACSSCLHECNLVNLPGGPFVEEQRGKMTKGRASVFGLEGEYE